MMPEMNHDAELPRSMTTQQPYSPFPGRSTLDEGGPETIGREQIQKLSSIGEGMKKR